MGSMLADQLVKIIFDCFYRGVGFRTCQLPRLFGDITNFF